MSENLRKIQEKHKRKGISLNTKIEILDRLAKGQGSTSVGKIYGLNEATVRTIKRNESAIRQSVAAGTKTSAKTTSYTRDANKEKMENALILWIEDHNQKRVPIDGNSIKEKAIRIYNKIKEQQPSTSTQVETVQFSASTGWLTGFLGRHSLHNIKIKGEIASADNASAREFLPKIEEIINKEGYTSDQVFNADETGLFWKRMPSRTYISQSEKSAGGFKAAKDRITVLLCTNASGDRVMKPLIINRAERPRAMKGVDLNKLPVHWKFNKKAWMTAGMFADWFHNLFIPELKRYLNNKGLPFKALLLIDNAPGHPPDLTHPNVKVVFLPPNTTSLIQPLDQGIISTFKSYYIKRTFQHILDAIDNDQTLTLSNAWKKFSLMDCIKHATMAVTEVRKSTLNACWKTVWPACVKSENQASPNTTEIHADIVNIAHLIGVEGLADLAVEEVAELTTDRVLSDEEILEVALETIDPIESSDDEETVLLSAGDIREGIQQANKLANHFFTKDHNAERAIQFQRDLNACMARYRECYKDLEKIGSQRLITEFVMKPLENENQRSLTTPTPSLCTVDISSDESFIEPIQRKRSRLLSGTDSD